MELRIFEGPSLQESKDVTFLYNANFFLYATLEHARVIAHGRVQTPAVNSPPVLTGMPVSGMAYLDRPQEAGYFLFPDLSVRHEGRYRLQFNLFEQTKEDKDGDMHPTESKLALEVPDSFDHRGTIHSNEFMVYSAKKFPGLTESTTLSRTVAEQGCRVRIRRDVRMRRRDGKGGADNDDEYARRQRTQTPEGRAFRDRSMSNESVQRTPYGPDAARRPAGHEYHAAPPPPGFGPPSGGSHLSFGGAPAGQYPPQPSSVPPSPSSYGPGQGPQFSPYPPPQATAYHAERPASQHYPEPALKREPAPEPLARPPSSSHYQGPPTPTILADRDDPRRSMPPMARPSDDRQPLTLPPLSQITAMDPSLPGEHPVPPRSMPAGPPIAPLDPRLGYGAVGGLPPLLGPPPSRKRSWGEFSTTTDVQRQPAFKNGCRPVEDHHRESHPTYTRATGLVQPVHESHLHLWQN